jgi:hypothetical protein
MEIFKAKTPLQIIDADIASITRREDRVTTKLPAARAEVEKAEAARLKALTAEDEDLKAETAAQQRVERARSVREGLEAARVELQAQRSAAEARRVAEINRIDREASAKKVRDEKKAASDALAKLMPAMKTCSECFGLLGNFHFDCRQISELTAKLHAELELGTAFALDEIDRIADGIESGAHPIPHRPKPAPVIAQPPTAPMRDLFATRPLAWTDAGGKINTHPAWHRISLPLPLAERALDLGAAVNLDHETAKANRLATREFVTPLLERCVALNDVGVKSAETLPDKPKSNGNGTTLPEGFEVLDRGPGYNVAVK